MVLRRLHLLSLLVGLTVAFAERGQQRDSSKLETEVAELADDEKIDEPSLWADFKGVASLMKPLPPITSSETLESAQARDKNVKPQLMSLHEKEVNLQNYRVIEAPYAAQSEREAGNVRQQVKKLVPMRDHK
mmetsp:Transcript_36677/g.84385  ORF Transcript_36677/g.84385 Transcript_36677/m.84385 type:complete len:132 (+) Transcript_36677:80-475(+)